MDEIKPNKDSRGQYRPSYATSWSFRKRRKGLALSVHRLELGPNQSITRTEGSLDGEWYPRTHHCLSVSSPKDKEERDPGQWVGLGRKPVGAAQSSCQSKHASTSWFQF